LRGWAEGLGRELELLHRSRQRQQKIHIGGL